MNLPPQGAETYLGDGLYVSFDGFQIILRAPRGAGPTGIAYDHLVYLEPATWQALNQWVAKYSWLKEHLEGH